MSFASRSTNEAATPAQSFGHARASLPTRRALEPARRASNSEADTRDAADGAGPSRASALAPPGHSLGNISVYGGAARDSSAAPTRAAISSSGGPTVTITYKPEAADKSSKIVFIQVAQFSLDGVAMKPGSTSSALAHMDGDTTSDNYVVDHVSGEADPYYNGDDAGLDIGTQGNATTTPKVDADMTDTPNYAESDFPTGKTTMKMDFHTIAFSAAGADKGKFYAYAHWSYNRVKGKAGTISHLNTSTNTALPKSKAAIDLWCTNHGFTLPK